MDDSGGDVTITEGGLDHKYVEIRFNSLIGKGLDYIVMVYTEFESFTYNNTNIITN